MTESIYSANLIDSRNRILSFVSDLLLKDCAEAEPTMFCWVTRRMEALKNVDLLADEIVKTLEDSIGHQHEFRINDADLKIKLRIEADGFVKGHVTSDFQSSESAKTKISWYLWLNGLDEGWNM